MATRIPSTYTIDRKRSGLDGLLQQVNTWTCANASFMMPIGLMQWHDLDRAMQDAATADSPTGVLACGSVDGEACASDMRLSMMGNRAALQALGGGAPLCALEFTEVREVIDRNCSVSRAAPIFQVTNGLICLLVLIVSACSSPYYFSGTYLAEHLHAGMSQAEVSAFVDKVKNDKGRFREAGVGVWRSGCTDSTQHSTYAGAYMGTHYPANLFSTVTTNSPCQYIEFWSTPTNYSRIYLFFDENTKQFTGWVNGCWYCSVDLYWHERLMSKVKIPVYDMISNKEMSREQVQAILGPPVSSILPPERAMASLPVTPISPPNKIAASSVVQDVMSGMRDDTFWKSVESSGPPPPGRTDVWDVYEYAIDGGVNRRVYMAYRWLRGAKYYGLVAVGYDHAQAEAERYLRERQIKASAR